MKKICLFLIFFLSINAFYLHAQDNLGQISGNSNLIEYLEFREVDIKDVLRQLAKQYDLNIVFSESVGGMVTVQLHDVTIEEALDAIISVNGFVYTMKQNVIKVTTTSEAEQEGKQTQVFRLNNADATRLRESLQKVISTEGSIEVDVRSNSLIVTDIPRVINEIGAMIADDLDGITPQVLIEARFIEVEVGATEKLGVDWSPGTEDEPQVKMNGASRATSAPFPTSGDEELENIFPEMLSSDTYFTSALGVPSMASSDFTFGTLDFTQLQMALNFLSSETDAKIISSPRIVTMDNKEARIQVGETRRIRTQGSYDADADTWTYTYEPEDVGIILVVTPQVTPDGRVKLKLAPEVSSIGSDSLSELEYIAKRVADTEVIVKNGQSIVIGGLIETKRTETVHKVPFLSDIPILGKAFTHTEVDPDSQKELLIFVTARVMDGNEKGLAGYKTGIVTSPFRPLKLDLREINPKNPKGKK